MLADFPASTNTLEKSSEAERVLPAGFVTLDVATSSPFTYTLTVNSSKLANSAVAGVAVAVKLLRYTSLFLAVYVPSKIVLVSDFP
jgi:hypothetical protein